MPTSPHTMRKRYVAEFIGTFIIVLAPCALAATAPTEGLLAAALVSGLAVLSAIYALGPISAAHFNPAVTLGFIVAKRFPAKYAAPYIAAQLVGALLAALTVRLLFGPNHGIHVPTGTHLQNLGTELLITFLLMFVIIAVATDKRVSGTVPGLAIGLTVVTGVFIGGNITGGSMNPARSLGPALVNGGPALAHVWLYILAPAAGATLAALLYESIRIDHAQAKGAPNELLLALEDISHQNSETV